MFFADTVAAAATGNPDVNPGQSSAQGSGFGTDQLNGTNAY